MLWSFIIRGKLREFIQLNILYMWQTTRNSTRFTELSTTNSHLLHFRLPCILYHSPCCNTGATHSSTFQLKNTSNFKVKDDGYLFSLCVSRKHENCRMRLSHVLSWSPLTALPEVMKWVNRVVIHKSFMHFFFSSSSATNQYHHAFSSWCYNTGIKQMINYCSTHFGSFSNNNRLP